MTVIFRDVLGTVQLTGVKHFQVLDDTTYFDFFDGAETIEKNTVLAGLPLVKNCLRMMKNM